MYLVNGSYLCTYTTQLHFVNSIDTCKVFAQQIHLFRILRNSLCLFRTTGKHFSHRLQLLQISSSSFFHLRSNRCIIHRISNRLHGWHRSTCLYRPTTLYHYYRRTSAGCSYIPSEHSTCIHRRCSLLRHSITCNHSPSGYSTHYH